MTVPPLEEIVSQMGVALGSNSGLGGTVKFDFGDIGSVLLDGKSTPNAASNGAGKSADCTISVSIENFEKMVNGQLNGTTAFMMGQLRVAGDMALAMRIGPILEKSRR